MWRRRPKKNTHLPTPLPHSLHRYAAPTVPPHARAIVLVAWVTSASVVALVPVDVYTALAGDAPGALPALWAAAYWTTQVCVCVCVGGGGGGRER